MDYDKIIIDLLNRIVTLEERVAKLENGSANVAPESTELPAGSKKYRFLSDYLYESNQARVKLSYADIENILKFKLPDSAATHRTFWANTTSHSIALSWLSVNYSVVEVNLENQYIVFEKMRDFDTMKTGRRTATTEEKHLSACKNYDMMALYQKLKEALFDMFEGAGTGATADYISWNLHGKRQFANFYIQKKKIRILTLTPRNNHSVGEAVPDTHLWTLNYQTDICTDADIEKVKDILVDSYAQIKLSI